MGHRFAFGATSATARWPVRTISVMHETTTPAGARRCARLSGTGVSPSLTSRTSSSDAATTTTEYREAKLQASELLRYVRERVPLDETNVRVTGNPLMLSMVISIFRSRGPSGPPGDRFSGLCNSGPTTVAGRNFRIFWNFRAWRASKSMVLGPSGPQND